jgi:transposase-like protein
MARVKIPLKTTGYSFMNGFRGLRGVHRCIQLGLLRKTVACVPSTKKLPKCKKRSSHLKSGIKKARRHVVKLVRDARRIDRHAYRCSCGKQYSVRNGSFFYRSKLSLRKLIHLLLCFSLFTSVSGAVQEVGVDHKTAIQWYQYFRDALVHSLDLDNVVLGGVGHVVEIDESMMTRRKYNVGKLVRQQWVFGVYSRTERKGMLWFVKNRKKKTLLDLIRKHIAPGTVIHSDCFSSYNDIDKLGLDYHHLTVNHTTNFRDPNTGACTNRVEGLWAVVKMYLKGIRGSRGWMTIQHIYLAIYKHNNRITSKTPLADRLKKIIADIIAFHEFNELNSRKL